MLFARMRRRGSACASALILSFTAQTILPSVAWARDDEPAKRRATTAADLEAGDVERVTELSDDLRHLSDDGVRDVPDTSGELTEAAEAALKQKGKIATADDVRAQPATEADSEQPTSATAVVDPGASGDKSGASSQAISVPKGAGSVEGMGESFSAQLSTGIAAFSVPIALPDARGAAQPSLSINYSSASGWGLAGIGWDVGVPYIARQTDRGVPRYKDLDDFTHEQDRFVFNGGQELVPICKVAGTAPNALTCVGDPTDPRAAALADEEMPPWSLGSQYFRSRVEGSFLRFFWSANHQTWRVQDKSGVTMELGVPLDSSGDRSGIQTNPDNQAQISRWSLVRQYDTQGEANPTSEKVNPTPVNLVVYRYDASNGPGVLLTDIYDTPPATDTTTAPLSAYAHHAHLRYEERPDPSTSYRLGWKVERRHRLVGVDVTSTTFSYGVTQNRRLVRRYHLSYASGYNISLLESVQVEGRCGSGDGLASALPEGLDGLLPRTTNCSRLPAMKFGYTHVEPFNAAGETRGRPLAGFEGFDERVRGIVGSPDRSADSAEVDFFDLNHDALPDVMVTLPGIYGSGFGQFLNAPAGVADTFSTGYNLPVFGVANATAGSLRLSNANVAVLDLDGDARVNLLHAPAAKTYAAYVLDSAGVTGRSVTTASNQDLKIDFGRDARTTKVLDVNGDGLVDVVVTTGTQIQTFFALGRQPGGADQFGTAERTGVKTAAISNEPVRACLPWSSSAVDFGDREIQLADMNGDGLVDIVRLQHGQVRYWPGRGNGMWGTGSLANCAADTFAPNTDVAMGGSPMFSDLSGSSLRLDDINGDGFDDLVQGGSSSVDVWLNINGSSWTPRHLIQGTPPNPAFADRLRLLDLNGSGTRDLVWADADRYQYIDLQGGVRPWLLSRVENGLGKSTDIEYSTSTAEMLAADRLLGACSDDTWTAPWCTKMPVVAHVVKRVTESDNLVFAGFGPNRLVTEYEYRAPVYDGRQREFRGFKRARVKKVGDSNSPSAFAESRFLLGECVDETPSGIDDCADLSADNPREALKGLPVMSETYNESGVYLSTMATAYRLRLLYRGRDGREVRHAFQSRTRHTLYDTHAGVPSGSAFANFDAVEVETTIDSGFDPFAAPVSSPSGLVKEAISLPTRSASGTAVLESAVQVDYFGNQQVEASLGCVSGAACPTATLGVDVNEHVFMFTVPRRRPDDESRWLYRTVESYVKGSVRTGVRGRTLTTFDAKGSPMKVEIDLQDQVALDRRHRTLTSPSAVALAPAEASTNGLKTIAENLYDTFGNPIQIKGANGRCKTLSYDSVATGYQHLLSGETVYTTSGCAGPSLTTGAAYDAGLGKLTVVTEDSLKDTTIAYDEFGRLSSLVRPRPSGTGTPQPSLTNIYTLPSVNRPYTTVETRTQDSSNVDGTTYLWSVSFVDGMGRTRLQRAEADNVLGLDGGSAIDDALVVYDAKGAVARKYLAQFASPATPLDPPAAPTGTFARVTYDAFGRQLATFDLGTVLQPGVQTLETHYHALSKDVFDAADLGFDALGAHQGTYATERVDGHGRTIVTTERVYEGGVLDERDVRTKYLPTGEPEVITRVHVGAADAAVVRWMRYDSMGRLVLNVDPHTTANFNADPTTSPDVTTNGLRPWRYAYNDAGDLVGTSDARGCGANYTYDAAGRVLTEDYSPCEAAHAPYSTPNPSTYEGIEVFYQYDAIPSEFSSVVGVPSGSFTSGIPAGYAGSSVTLKGQLAAVFDRSGLQIFTYDKRGRSIRLDRRLADPDPTVVDPRLRYRGRWYSTTTDYDAADRVILQSTGATSPEFLVASASELKVDYSTRGTPKRVHGSYGELVTSVKRSADGLLEEVVYGDAAVTTARQTYNDRRWLSTSEVARASASLWASPPGNYLPVPTPLAAPSSFQMILRDESFSYDIVGNPTAITDFRTDSEWPAGAKPVSVTAEYDDLYRLKQLSYAYPGGSDSFVSPFAAEAAGSSDPRQSSNYPPHLLPSQRVTQQTYSYDWLGSITNADDDQHAMWDRGVGPVSNHAATGKPYRWKSAGDLANPSWAGSGTAEALSYDEAGNLLDLQTTKVGTCSSGGSSCSVRFTYAYDEMGRLNQGKRIQSSSTVADLRFTYDYTDDRVYKGDYTAATKYFSVYLFDTLELRRATYDSTAGDFLQNATTETPFLSIAGEGVGRLTYEGSADGEPRIAGSRLHVLLNIGDQLGSSSVVVDKTTGELVERRTYLAYGATESDYRPARWKGFREDYGFTGKEEDIEIGLQYFGKRFLNPYLGRWVSPDPLAVHSPGEADLNLYAYVRGKVLQAVDPLGLDDVNWGAVEAVAAGPRVDTVGGWVSIPEPAAPAPAPSSPSAPSARGGGGPSASGPSASYEDTGEAPPPHHADFPDAPPPSQSNFPDISPDSPDAKMSGTSRPKPGGNPCSGPGQNTCSDASSDGQGSPGRGTIWQKIATAAKRIITKTASRRSLVEQVKGRLSQYPRVLDPRTQRLIKFPVDQLRRVPIGKRVIWGSTQRGEFIKEWHNRGYATPRGGWKNYDIHHILPREFGGTNDFWNLVPVERTTHRLFNSFWSAFVQ